MVLRAPGTESSGGSWEERFFFHVLEAVLRRASVADVCVDGVDVTWAQQFASGGRLYEIL